MTSAKSDYLVPNFAASLTLVYIADTQYRIIRVDTKQMGSMQPSLLVRYEVQKVGHFGVITTCLQRFFCDSQQMEHWYSVEGTLPLKSTQVSH